MGSMYTDISLLPHSQENTATGRLDISILKSSSIAYFALTKCFAGMQSTVNNYLTRVPGSRRTASTAQSMACLHGGSSLVEQFPHAFGHGIRLVTLRH